MKKRITIGCSSYNNKYWNGVFYPEGLSASERFEYYCQHFDTFEINATFYKFPTLTIMENWYKRAPAKFLYSVKAPKIITHLKKLNDCEEQLEQFYTVCKEGLREKLSYVLFQFPPSYHYTPERLEQVISAMDPTFSNVVEFRHESWWNTEVWQALAQHNITFCSVSYPKLPGTIFTDYPIVYIRLHGTPRLFYSAYSREELLALSDAISKTKTPKKVVVYFNNTASIAGIQNALELHRLLGLE